MTLPLPKQPPVSDTDFSSPAWQAYLRDINKYLLSSDSTNAFTPYIYGVLTAGTGTYTTQVGAFFKIGRVVIFTLSLAWTAHTGTGAMRIGGLPYTSSNNIAVTIGYAYNIAYTANNYMVAWIDNSTAYINMGSQPVGGTVLNLVAMSNTGNLTITGIYFI